MRRALLLAVTLLCLSATALGQGTTSYPASLDTDATLPQAVDNKFTYLTAAVTGGATAFPVNSTSGLPSTVIAQVDSELLSCSVTNATTLTCSRGFSGTAAAAHAIRAAVRFPLASAHVNGARGAVIELEEKLGAGASDASAASAGHVLKKNGDGTTGWGAAPVGAISLSDLPQTPQVRAYHSANQAVANNTSTVLALDSESYDTDSMHSGVTNNSRVTFTTAGLYSLTAAASFASNATGYRVLNIRLNGTTYIGSNSVSAVSGNEARMVVATAHRFAAGDYVELEVYQNSGGSLNVASSYALNPTLYQWSPHITASYLSK